MRQFATNCPLVPLDKARKDRHITFLQVHWLKSSLGGSFMRKTLLTLAAAAGVATLSVSVLAPGRVRQIWPPLPTRDVDDLVARLNQPWRQVCAHMAAPADAPADV